MSQVQQQTELRAADPLSAGLAILSHLLIEQLRLLTPAKTLAILKQLDPHLLKAALEPEATLSEDNANRRRRLRSRTLKSGKIIYNNQLCVLDCLIRDISSTGCRIRVANPGMVPNHFTLVVIGTSQKHNCNICWRTARELGVNFAR